MDLTEAFAPSQAGGGTATDEKTTDYFDFVVSPPPHCASADGTVDEDSFLHRAGCRTTIGYLGDTRLHHDGFIKETNNNTLTALPPVSTITGSLGHIGHHHNHHNRNARSHGCHLTTADPVGMDQGAQDCDYWVTEDSKEQTCNILLEDLNKYCWTTQTSTANDHHGGLLIQRRDSPLGDGLQVHHRDSCTSDDRQNTDGAIYTLTVLNSEANSMDGLECCKSPTPGAANDGWTLRPNHLDLDAILNMESSVSIGGSADGTGQDGATVSADRDHDRQVVVTANGTTVDGRYSTVTTSQYTTDEQAPFGVTIKTEPGDNNNDWKLSDRNNLQETVAVTESAAESLLRNALQGKLYPGSVSSTSLAGATAARILGADGQTVSQPGQDEAMHGCAEDLLLSQLDVDSAYRTTGDYEKLKNIANEVVESYCNLEPVCNVSATTVMYTLDPASGSLGTITLPADLAQVGTVTVVTTAPPQQDVLHQETRHAEPQQQPTSNQRQPTTPSQLQLPGSSTGSSRGSGGTKPAKKYVRRANRNSANGAAGSGAAGAGSSGSGAGQGGAGASGTAGSPGGTVQQRKERSLHYCSICSKGFKDKYSVNVHIRTHTGEKPFACSLCGKSFRQKAHLAKHYQTHVTQKPSVAAAAAQAAAQAAVQAATSTGTGATAVTASSSNNNSSNGATSNASSNSGSARGAPSPTTPDIQVANVVQQQQQQQQQQQMPVVDSPIVTAACNPTS